MSRKHQRIHNTYNITNEIDYDKLAEAILSALKTHQQSQYKKSFTTSMFAGICSIVFRIIASISCTFVIIFALYPFAKQLGIYDKEFIASFPNILSLVVCIILFGTFTFLFWKASDEIANERDKNYIISMFSSMVSVAAMVIAAVSLFFSK